MQTFYQLINANRLLRIANKSVITLAAVRNWVTAFRDYRKKSEAGKVVLQLRSGQELVVRANSVDAHDAVTVLCGQEYPYRWFRDMLKPNDMILDVGAHVGAFTLFLKGKCPDLEVHAFEPAPDNFSFLNENVRRNKLKNVTLWQNAVAGNGGEVFLATDVRDSNSYRISTSGTRVKALSLDDFIAEQGSKTIALLKLDCEGAEYEILERFRGIGMARAIIMEYHAHANGKDGDYLVKLLAGKGFALRQRKDLRDKSRGILFFVRQEKP